MAYKTITLMVASAAVALASSGASAADFPDKPVRIVVPFAAGTATDQLARALGQAMAADGKTQVIVDNKPGGNGFIGAEAVARSAPDGYTVFVTTNTTHAAAEHLYKKLPYDPVKDFAPITGLGKGGQILVVHGDSPVKTVSELVAQAKKEPGKITFGSGSSSSRIAGELFQQMAGVQLLHVPYKSNTFAVTDLLGKQIDMMITDSATGLPHVKSGKLRALGVSSKTRSPLLPEVPTFVESGYPKADFSAWFCLFVPAGTAESVIHTLHQQVTAAAQSPDVKRVLEEAGFSLVGSSTADARRMVAAEAVRWKGVVAATGFRGD